MLAYKKLVATPRALSRATQVYCRRTMATKVSLKQEWICIIPDQAGVLDKRLEVRPSHLEAITKKVSNDTVLLGGGYMSEPPQEGQKPKVIGSVMLFNAESKEEVIQALKADIYTTSGVWDWDKIQIYPFRSAVGKVPWVPQQ